MKSIITLTTDFGARDGYVGQMKGVILGINPEATILDVTHDIAPYAVFEGALVLKGVIGRFTFPSFHIAVIDPGVGGKRKPLAIRVADRYLIGPDNGLFSLVIGGLKEYEARVIANPDFMAPAISHTFHGRDIFAPAAAQLSLGRDFQEIGPVLERLQMLETPQAIVTRERVTGKIIHVDRFGNLITNIESQNIQGQQISVRCGPVRIGGLASYYCQADPKSPIALINSFDLLEIALPSGNASEQYGIGVGADVEVVFGRC